MKKRPSGYAETSKPSKYWGQSPQENFCRFTLYFGLTSTDNISACAALELLITSQQLFESASLVKFLNMIFFGLECLSYMQSLRRPNGKPSHICDNFQWITSAGKFLRTHTLLSPRTIPNGPHNPTSKASKNVSLGQCYDSLSTEVL